MSVNNDEELNDEKDVKIDLNKEILSFAEDGDVSGVKKCLSFDRNLVNACDEDMYRPIHRASYNNHMKVIELLVSCGANVRSRTIDGWEPIHCAAKWGHIEAIHLLLKCGADINAVSNGDIDITLKNDSGDTAYDIAKRYSHLYRIWDYL